MTRTNVALVSGGMDSAVAAHVSVRWGPCDLLVYLDTGTGLEENREYCEELADHLGVQLWTLRTHESYEERVEEDGFPGPSRHSIMYRSLKERQIGKLATIVGGHGNGAELNLYTGVRSDESERRMQHVSEQQDAPRWTWHAPIHDWTKQDCREYIDQFGIPKNDLWNTLGRSGDCFCGCFGSPEEKLDLRAAGVDYHADWIESLEDSVQIDGTEKEREMWAWGARGEQTARAEMDDQQMTLCSTCGMDYPARTDGGTDNDASRTKTGANDE
jgi:3'-phosphoadenosine 5'-phosphosulfate sulfotransferase (PAPS reductase)/FAD synthetase